MLTKNIKQNQTSYQYEPLKTPASWNEEEKRFAIRLSGILQELYRRSGRSVLDAWPVGSVYLSLNETDPSSLFGGVWERLKDRFLLAAGDERAVGTTGGSEEETLEEKHLPPVSGTLSASSYGNAWGVFGSVTGVFSRGSFDVPSPLAEETSATNQRVRSVTMSFGEGKAHNNMPPYLTVYMWKRVS